MTSPSKDDWISDSGLTPLDRSTLERWATCPAQAWLVEHGGCVNENRAMSVGQEAHEVLAKVTRSFVESPGESYPGLLQQDIDVYACDSRPDVQPDVIACLRPSMWSWANFLSGIHVQNILRWDGGPGEFTGQLAWEVSMFGAQVTTEVDLLYAGESPEVIHEVDYKTGYTDHNWETVSQSFQFQLHAALLLDIYPDVSAIDIRVWNTRKGKPTHRVLFERSKLGQYQQRIHKSVEIWHKFHDAKTVDDVESWPDTEKCGLCPVAHLCPRLANVETDPVELLRQYVVLEAASALVRSKLITARKTTGKEIETPEGDVFGVDKPRTRDATYSLYRNT